MSCTGRHINNERLAAEIHAAWENARAALHCARQSPLGPNTPEQATIPSLTAARSILRMGHGKENPTRSWRDTLLYTHPDKTRLDPGNDTDAARADMPVLMRLESWWKASLFMELAEIAKNWLADSQSSPLGTGRHAAIQGKWPAPGLPRLERRLSLRFQLAWASDRLLEAQNRRQTARVQIEVAAAEAAVAFLEAAISELRAEAARDQPPEPRPARSAPGMRPSPGTSSRTRRTATEAAAEAARRQRAASERAEAAQRAAEEARREDARRRSEDAQRQAEARRRREREQAD